MLRPIPLFALFVGLMAFLLPAAVRAQVPDVQGQCVSGCGSSGSNSDARNQHLAWAYAQHAKEVQWYNEIETRWKSAAKAGNNFSHQGQKALAMGECAVAAGDFQRELAAFSVDLTPRGNLIDAKLGSGYRIMVIQQQVAINNARNRIAGAQANCVQQRPGVASVQGPKSNSLAQFQQNTTQPANIQNAALTSAEGAPRIGAASSVKGTVYWLTDRGAKVPIKSGTPIFFGSRIVTENGGHMQILLLDGTQFTTGPNSDMVLDEFVYDPNTSDGKIAASLAKGTFRWVTGTTMRKDPGNMRVKLAVGTIGIRGTDFQVKYQPGSEGYIELKKGELQITPNASAAFSMKAGDKVTIQANGSILPPSLKH